MKIPQAQIEAAAKAMEQEMFAPHELPLDDELHAKYLDTAEAALAAAAEVGESEIARLKTECIKAAKEIDKIADRAEAEFKEREAATIERCAQVADKWLAYGVAEDIRALKGKE